MKSYKKTIINNINKHFKKMILGFCVLCILFYVIKYYNNKENFNINWNTISYLNQQDPTNLNSEDIDINSGNLNFNLKCDGTNGLKTLCETCHKNYNNTCFKGNTNNMCDMVLNSNQCENKCGLESPKTSFDYNRYSGNYNESNNLNFSSDKTYKNITSLHQCEKLCDLNGHESYKYNKKTKQCDTSSIPQSNLETNTNYTKFDYGTIDKDTFTQDSIFIGTNKMKLTDWNCYTKYNYNKSNQCQNDTKVNKIPIKELNVLDYKECEKLCSKYSNESENCKGYTFEKNDNLKSDGKCKLYERFIESDGCKPFKTQLDSLYKDTNNEFMFQSGIIKV
jgi:hypothetical protein